MREKPLSQGYSPDSIKKARQIVKPTITDEELAEIRHEQELENLMAAPNVDIGSKEGALWRPPASRQRSKEYPREGDK